MKTPEVYNDYIYDIGDELSGSDLDERIERFEATYPSKRREYSCTKVSPSRQTFKLMVR